MSDEQFRLEFESTGHPAPKATRAAPNGGPPSGRSRPLTRDDVMTAQEVGALLRLPGSSVYELARRGAIPGHRIGRAWRFVRHEIEEWLLAS